MLSIIGIVLGFVFCCALIYFAVLGYSRMSAGMNRQAPPASVVAESLAAQATRGSAEPAQRDLRAVTLEAPSGNKIESIRIILRECPQHGMAACKYLVDHAPQVLCARMTPADARRLQSLLEAAGMRASIS